MTNFVTAVNAYWRAVREGKGVNAARAMRDAVMLGNADEVADFIRQAQIRAGKQDLALLPERSWNMDGKGISGNFDNRPEAARVEVPTTAELRTLLERVGASAVRISWPSVTSHWGVAIFWIDGGRDYRAVSSDWQLTETYLSS